MAVLLFSIITGGAIAEPPTLRTRQKVFEIPFSLAPAGSLETQPAQVQLMVSGDYGKSWQLYQQQQPSVGKFAFQAGPDGEFWFHVRTLGPRGELIGPPRNGPELKVVVDTEQPLLELASGVGPNGEMQAQWRISDNNLDISTFSLEYRSDESDQWQRVAVDYPRDGQMRDTVDGHAKWWPATNGGPLTVRGQVQDGAGNKTVVQRRIEASAISRPRATANWLPPLDTPPIKSATPPGVAAVAPGSAAPAPTSPPTTPTTPSPAADSHPGTAQPTFSQRGLVANNPYFQTPTPVPPPTNVSTTDSPSTPGPRATATPVDEPWIARRASQPPVPHHDHARSWKTEDRFPPLEGTSAGQPPEITALGRNSGETAAQQPARVPSQSPGRMVTHGRHQAPAPATATPTHSSQTSHIDPSNIRVSKSRRFRLEYDVEAVGQAGVARVELWTTRDGGQTWHHFGDDPDKMSPFMVTVDQDGVYGYRLVIQANQGLAMRPPDTGDPADIWISVDSTSPAARITSAKYGSGMDIGRLHITWEANDQNLEDAPITLSVSAQADGPWTPIAEGIENTGQYAWQVTSEIPRNVYLRLQVRDKAGNVTEYRLRDPISSDGLAPRGRIRAVAPAQHVDGDLR